MAALPASATGRAAVVTILAVWGSVSCGSERRRPIEDDQTASVRSVIARIIRADNAGDLEAVVGLYAEDAILLPPGDAPIRGLSAIREHYARIFDANELEVAFDSEETVVAGDWAFDRGTTTGWVRPRSGGAPVSIDDKYVMILRRDPERGWLISRLIWNAR